MNTNDTAANDLAFAYGRAAAANRSKRHVPSWVPKADVAAWYRGYDSKA